jgi:hypothetical protein
MPPTAQKRHGCDARLVRADHSASLSHVFQGQVRKVVL